MTYIKRHFDSFILNQIIKNPKKGLILTGIVGCGKTSFINNLCNSIKDLHGYDILKYDGDDVVFRNKIRNDNKLILNEILEKGLNKPFVFVDEVQKEPEIFDALKIAYDKSNVSFIVSGSNPSFLNTIGKDRLQRRAEIYNMHTFSISEILLNEKYLENVDLGIFIDLFTSIETLKDFQITKKIKLNENINNIVNNYLFYGGLPLSYLANGHFEKLQEIKLVAERGITETYKGTINQEDQIRAHLATQNSKEFTYKGIDQKLRNTKRDLVDAVIDHLLNHGYILKKKPYLHDYELKKSTYFSIFSWTDPGIVSYYEGINKISEMDAGFRLEAYVHNIFQKYLERIPLRSEIFYYKPFKYKKVNDSLDFQEGEIDFIIKIGPRIIPIEVKKTSRISEIDINLITKVIKDWNIPFGIIIYGGSPFVDYDMKLVYFPYWLL